MFVSEKSSKSCGNVGSTLIDPCQSDGRGDSGD